MADADVNLYQFLFFTILMTVTLGGLGWMLGDGISGLVKAIREGIKKKRRGKDDEGTD